MNSPKYSIVGMGACAGAAEGLDRLDQLIFDSSQAFSCRTVNGVDLFGGFLAADSAKDKSGLTLLERVVKEAVDDANMGTITGEISGASMDSVASLSLNDCGLILVSDDVRLHDSSFLSDSTVLKECKSILQVSSFAEALRTTEKFQDQCNGCAVIVAAVHLMDEKLLSSHNVLQQEPRLVEQETPSLVFDASDPIGVLGEGAAAMVLVRHSSTLEINSTHEINSNDEDSNSEESVQFRAPRHYSTIEAFADVQNSNIDQSQINNTLQQALSLTGIAAADVSYLEVTAAGDTTVDDAELQAILSIYGEAQTENNVGKRELKSVMGSATTTFGYANCVSSLLSVIKTSLCLYHRYLPGTPGWTGPKDTDSWSESSVYVPNDSRSWFVEHEAPQRNAAVSLVEGDRYSHIILSDQSAPIQRPNQYLAEVCCYVFPIAGDTESELADKLGRLLADLVSPNLKTTALQYYRNAELEVEKRYAAIILGDTRESLEKEVASIQNGLSKAFTELGEIKTPKGSYFTASPLGRDGDVAFMYPGVGSSYVGLGQKIFHLFPSVYETAVTMTSSLGRVLKEDRLYPRSQHQLSFKEKRQIDVDLHSDLDSIGETDTAFSVVCTKVMMNVFGVTPTAAFGYSMGEASMMSALSIWTNPAEVGDRITHSPIFKNKLYGELSSLKEFWGLPQSTDSTTLWNTLTMKASAEDALKAIGDEKQVYLALINTPENVVITGERKACERVVERLGCRAISMGFVPAIHSPPTRTEYEGIVNLYTQPLVENQLDVKLYSTSCYLPVPHRSNAIAHAIAKCFCDPVDFPRIVNKAYDEGARIFVEAGAGRSCCTWIDKILKNKEHVVVPLNAKGTDDHLTFTRAIAKLYCHRVEVDLAPFYNVH
ncbi:MAG: PfaB family protein [Pseudomonadales bacterium]|nr:PfaB family protein [Pseudomonadales bacterium]